MTAGSGTAAALLLRGYQRCDQSGERKDIGGSDRADECERDC